MPLSKIIWKEAPEYRKWFVLRVAAEEESSLNSVSVAFKEVTLAILVEMQVRAHDPNPDPDPSRDTSSVGPFSSLSAYRFTQ